MKRLPLLLTLLALAAAPSRAEDPATNAPAIPESVAELSRVLSEQEGYPIPVGMIFARALNEEMTADEFARAKLAELGVEGWADAGDGATGEDDPPNPFLGEPNPNLVSSPPKPSPDNPAARALEAWWRAEKEREPAAVALLVADASGRPAFDVVPLDDPAAPSRAELVRLDALPGDAEWMLRLPGPDVSAETWFSADTLAPTGGLLRIRGLEGRGDAGSPSARAAEILLPAVAGGVEILFIEQGTHRRGIGAKPDGIAKEDDVIFVEIDLERGQDREISGGHLVLAAHDRGIEIAVVRGRDVESDDIRAQLAAEFFGDGLGRTGL